MQLQRAERVFFLSTLTLKYQAWWCINMEELIVVLYKEMTVSVL